MNNLLKRFNLEFNAAPNEPAEAGFYQKLLGRVVREVTKGTMVIRTRDFLGNLLDLKAIERFIGKKEACNVKAMVERSFERYRSAAGKKQIVFLAGVPAGIRVLANRRALQEVLDRLIASAIRYSPANGAIQVHALPQTDNVIINVRDQGVGLNEPGRQKLLQRFSRLMSFQSGGESSSGIALAIVKELAGAFSGSIRWRGDSESGSTFTLRLPVASESDCVAGFSEITMLAHRIIEFQARN